MIDYNLSDDAIRDCLRLAAKKAAIECVATIRSTHPEIIIDDWLVKYAERRAYEMDCEKFGIEGGAF
jgi:hypothetical protein